MNYQPLNKWAELYADYVNNFLTIEKWAEHYDMSIEQANDIYTLGRMSDNFSKSITL
jgi:hypothetical protein